MDTSRTACDTVAAHEEAGVARGARALEACCPGASVEALNEGCFCVSVDRNAIREALSSELGTGDLFALTEERCPHVFAARPVFLSGLQVDRMRQLIGAIESVVALPAWREAVLSDAPAIARHAPGGAKGVFFGYDFHLHGHGVSLIEINTNAGGAMLNAVVAKAQRACCGAVEALLPALDASGLEAELVRMFRAEWAASARTTPLKTIAIVDANPAAQYLYPEFLLFQRLFRQHGIDAVIADPAALRFDGRTLRHGDAVIDLVYNRLTDFMLQEPDSAALREAYLHNAVVLTPHPQAHALYANKRNLVLLTDPEALREMGVPPAVQAILRAGIPRTESVCAANAERLWAERRRLFFKPAAGFGSRAAYRGDKLTKRVWEEILAGDYVAQALVPPGERATDAGAARLKFDIRAYGYDGAIQWLAARLYQGQTTNFRTPGGGFAPVYTLD